MCYRYQWFKTSQNHDHHSAAQDKLIDDAVDHNVATLRHRVNALCPSPPSSSYDRSSYIHTQSTYPQSEDVCHRTLLVYQRDKNRDIADLRSHLNALVSHLQRPDHGSLCSWQIRVLLHSDQAHPCQLHHDLSAADVLLTSHSFQEIGKTSLCSSC